MASKVCPWLLLALVLAAVAGCVTPAEGVAFDENYVAQWGHLQVNQGMEADLTLDQSSGAGFRSKSMYGSGFFHMRMKLPAGYTAGVVTTFYLISQPEDGGRDEVDFEFLGTKDGNPMTLQTNIVVNGSGYREQRLHLWFDPAADFHDYKILWNPYQLMMFVDDTPVRVLQNLTATVPGYPFPAKQTMLIRASIWDGSDWATDKGKARVDWSKAPFTAGYQGFNVDACIAGASATTPCDSPTLWWNGVGYRNITTERRAAYDGMKRKYRHYNYCADRTRFNNTMPVECSYEQ
ncbi:hypothetical protein EJB05_45500, partial [Eragrostis curvula]